MRKTLVCMVRVYQAVFAPLLGHRCRFYPSCSRYCVEALENRPIIEALRLSALRLFRCNPLFEGGFDPLPERKKT